MADKAKSATRADIQQKIVALAWKDEAFRKAFLKDPKGEAERRLGVKLRDGLKIAAHAEDENHLFFVIPAKPAPKRPTELSDQELEKVSGGIMTPRCSSEDCGFHIEDLLEDLKSIVQAQKSGW